MAKGYDFIVIGGGSAGCVLAARLTEDPSTSVLLLEAGGRDLHPFYHLPAGFAKMTKGLGSWGWSTVPQQHLKNAVVRFTQAKVIGGGSTINAQIYTRGNALDYDEWRQMGCTGWGYDDVLPYFRKAEDNDTFENRYHGKGGPIGVSQPRAPLPICEAFFAAAAELGIPRNPDLTGASQEGVGYYQLTQRNARRSSAAREYLGRARGRPNLTVTMGREVKRIVVENGRATGVEMADGERITADAEVILSSGAIGSPRLLMLSGIAPRTTSAPSGSRRCSTSRASDRTSRTISTSSSSRRSRDRTPTTATRSRSGRWWRASSISRRGAGRWRPASSRPAGSGTPTPTPARRISSSTSASAPASRRASRRCRTAA
jgi:choline dehydrogenase-like flavoprotein